ncbi:hypothetical protein [Xanthomonas phage XAJ2]|uniref:Uncharacterized protein n=1 Tax=Xanthomonas phage XAJ2 TaxID=1775249 RepID=A0A1I9L2H7_9CAUD|nr:hypothetical protein [Xanthomonas phage XAJ2]
MTKFTCQCSRCDGNGKFDRGTCFTCKGVGYENKARRPSSLTAFTLLVAYSNGTTNKPTIWATSKKVAVKIVERMISIKGWEASVS